MQPLSVILVALAGSLLHGILLDDGRARLTTEGVGHVGERCIHLHTLLMTQIIVLILQVANQITSHYLRVVEVGCIVVTILRNHLWASSVDDARHWLLIILVFFVVEKVWLHKGDLLLLLLILLRLMLVRMKVRC